MKRVSSTADAAFLQERYQLLVESVEDYAIFTLSSAGIIETWNRGAQRIKGYSADEIIGNHFSKFYPLEDIKARKPEHELEVAAQVGRFEDEGWRVRKDGSLFWANVIITALRDPKDGSLAGYAKVTRDLTQRKTYEDALRASEEGLSATLYSIGDAVITTDETGRITRLNRVAEYLTGWAQDEAQGRPIEEIFHLISDKTGTDADSPVSRILREGVTIGLANHAALISRDGTERPIADSGAPIRDVSGKIRGAVVVFRDVTEEREAHEALRKSEERFRLLVSQVRDYAIFMLDPAGHIASWNAGAERLKGYQADEIIGRHFSEFYPDEDLASEKPRRELEEAVRNGRVEDEGWRIRKDGSRFWANVVITALRDEKGALVGFAKVTRDLTERRQASERLLQEQVARAETETARKRAAFLADLSRTLVESRDPSSAVRRIAKLTVPVLGDYCVVDLRSSDGSTEQLAVAHVDPDKEHLVARLRQLQPPESFEGHPTPRVLRSRKPDIARNITDEMFIAAAKSAEYLEILRRLHPTSHMVIPLLIGSEAIGTISFVSTRPERQFTDTDLALAEDLAHRAALVIEHARLYKAERDARVAAEDSGRKLERILEQLPVGVVLAEAASGRLLMANQEFQRIFGESLGPNANLPGANLPSPNAKDVSGKLHTDGGAEYEGRPLAHVVSKGETVHGEEMRILRKDGVSCWVSVNAGPVRNPAGELVAGVVTFHDITERKRASEMVEILANAGSILGSSLEYETTLQQLADLVVPRLADWCTVHIPDSDGVIHAVAVAHADPIKLKWARELVHRDAPLVDDPHGIANVLRTGQSELYCSISDDLIRQATRSDEHFRILRELGMKSALIVPLRIHGRTIGTLAMVCAESQRQLNSNDVAVAEELGRRAAFAVENARLFQATQRAVEVRDEFVSIASHELKTPLTALQLHVQGLLASAEQGIPMAPERNRAKLRAVAEQVDRQERLVNDLLDFSRISSGRLALQLEEVDLRELAMTVAERFEDQLQKANCQLTIDAPKPIMGMWDRFRLDQVFTNLLSNALKYAPGKTIELRLSESDAFAHILVMDHGPGIALEDQERIFNRFERAASRRNYGGFGLGLWIVREIVSRLGGTVSVASEPGQGATFKVELPLKSMELTQPREAV